MRRPNSDGFETASMGSAAHRETAAKCEPPHSWDVNDGIKGGGHRTYPFVPPLRLASNNQNKLCEQSTQIMKSEVETQPFLAFSDDPAGQAGAAAADGSLPTHREALVKTSGTRRLLRDLVICLTTSLLWVLVIWIFIPGPGTTSSSPSSSSPADDGAAPSQMPSQGISVITGEDMARIHNITSGAQYISCGNSTEEARSKGCTYDTLLNAWVPAQCLDQEWIDEYQDDASWTAFSECVSPAQRILPRRPKIITQRGPPVLCTMSEEEETIMLILINRTA